MPDQPLNDVADDDENFDPDFDWPDEPVDDFPDDETGNDDTNPEAPASGAEEQ